jgi:endonuclease YncB( thermonuclease family)
MKAKELGHNARDRLAELITGEPVPPIAVSQDPVEAEKEKKKWIQNKLNSEVYLVWVECKEMDKYGRILIDMKKDPSDTQTFSELLLKEKLAYCYGGATKLTEEQQVALLSSN